MRPRLSRDNRAVGAFFEDIPALIIVTIALGIFFIGMISAFQIHAANRDAENFRQEARDFSDYIRTYDGLRHEASKHEGYFDYVKVLTVTGERIELDSNFQYEFRVRIDDLSVYDHYLFNTSRYMVPYLRDGTIADEVRAMFATEGAPIANESARVSTGGGQSWTITDARQTYTVYDTGEELYVYLRKDYSADVYSGNFTRGGEMVSIESLVNIYLSPEEVHIARMVVTIKRV